MTTRYNSFIYRLILRQRNGLCFLNEAVPLMFRFVDAYKPVDDRINAIRENDILNNLPNNQNEYHLNYLYYNNENYTISLNPVLHELDIDLTQEINNRFEHGYYEEYRLLFELKYFRQENLDNYEAIERSILPIEYSCNDAFYRDYKYFGWGHPLSNKILRYYDNGIIFSVDIHSDYTPMTISGTRNINGGRSYYDVRLLDTYKINFDQKVVNSSFELKIHDVPYIQNPNYSFPGAKFEISASMPNYPYQHYINNFRVNLLPELSSVLSGFSFDTIRYPIIEEGFSVDSLMLFENIFNESDITQVIQEETEFNTEALCVYGLQGIDNTIFSYETGRDNEILNPNCLMQYESINDISLIYERPKYISSTVAFIMLMNYVRNEGSGNPEENEQSEASKDLRAAEENRNTQGKIFKQSTGIESTAVEGESSTSDSASLAAIVMIVFFVALALVVAYMIATNLLWYLKFMWFITWLQTQYYKIKYLFLLLLGGIIRIIKVILTAIADGADAVMKFIKGIIRYLKELFENFVIKPIKKLIKDAVEWLKKKIKEMLPGSATDASLVITDDIIKAILELVEQIKERDAAKAKCSKEEAEIAENLRKIMIAKRRLQEALSSVNSSISINAININPSSYFGPLPKLSF